MWGRGEAQERQKRRQRGFTEGHGKYLGVTREVYKVGEA
jgi:hypothetical protein